MDTAGNDKWLIKQLANLDKDLPLLDLILFFHAFHDVDAKVGANERRNLAVLRALRPSYDLGFGGMVFKPLNFIHKYNEHYSLPGYFDEIVLPRFFRVTDWIVKNGRQGPDFLAFVYVFFLLVHPLTERNGRVIRSVLDYYRQRWQLDVRDCWNDPKPQKFEEREFHRKAFDAFFLAECKLPPLREFGRNDPFPIAQEMRPALGQMANYMIDWAEKIGAGMEPVGRRPQVRYMSDGIQDDGPKT
jgi:hypothetical protein